MSNNVLKITIMVRFLVSAAKFAESVQPVFLTKQIAFVRCGLAITFVYFWTIFKAFFTFSI